MGVNKYKMNCHCEEERRSNRNQWDCFVPRNDILHLIMSAYLCLQKINQQLKADS